MKKWEHTVMSWSPDVRFLATEEFGRLIAFVSNVCIESTLDHWMILRADVDKNAQALLVGERTILTLGLKSKGAQMVFFGPEKPRFISRLGYQLEPFTQIKISRRIEGSGFCQTALDMLVGFLDVIGVHPMPLSDLSEFTLQRQTRCPNPGPRGGWISFEDWFRLQNGLPLPKGEAILYPARRDGFED